MHLVHRTTCRVCGSATSAKVIDLGEQNLPGSFIKPGQELPLARKIACTLVRCDPTRDEHACGLRDVLPADDAAVEFLRHHLA